MRQAEQTPLADVIEVLRAVIPGSPELAEDTELLTSGLLDSLSLVTAVARLESRFGFLFPPDALVPETFETPAALSEVVVDQLAETTS